MVQVIRYAIPDFRGNTIVTHYQDGRQREEAASDLYGGKRFKHAVLRLLRQTATAIDLVREVAVPFSQQLAIEFSDDGAYLAILLTKMSWLLIYEVPVVRGGRGDLEELFKQLEAETIVPVL